MTTTPNGLESQEFVARLDEEIGAMLNRLGQMSAAGTASETLTVERLLRLALKNELEATELAAIWLATTQEIDVKLALARQCGDEAKHYRMIAERLEAMGVDAAGIDPRAGGYSPLFEFLRSLESTPARVAAGQFTREGLALVRNQAFIEFCEARGDHETATLYREVIQPDEQHHHELGRRLLLRYAITVADQQVAHDAARRTLELAEEVQETARMKAGISHAPGC
ncbi:MAG TPA: ferritin-like domain-containing protein [Blastocatellia bacterium]|nr:ferritin-like domain-containing protein [Blastocatellia bacterium]